LSIEKQIYNCNRSLKAGEKEKIEVLSCSDAISRWAGWDLGFQLTLFQPGRQIMPTTLMLAHPDLKT
jgi:hypothetical protein